jgi:uncharacterized protein YfiM (DUF2279 family)
MFESYVYIAAGVKMQRNKTIGDARRQPFRL